MRLQAAIFDMDGTLLDSMPTWNAQTAELFRRREIVPAPDLLDFLRPLGGQESMEYCIAHYGLKETPQQLMDEIYDQMRTFYGNSVRPKPGVERLLSLLKMDGVWMYVATATDRPLTELALEHTGLDKYFRGIVTCAEAGRGKNHPDIYEKALRRLQCRKADAVVFEDALTALRTAKAAGFRVAGVADVTEPDQTAMEAEADYYIRSFEDWTDLETV